MPLRNWSDDMWQGDFLYDMENKLEGVQHCTEEEQLERYHTHTKIQVRYRDMVIYNKMICIWCLSWFL